MSLTGWIIGSMAAYLAVILLIGFVAGRGSASTNEGFYVASRKLTWWQDSFAVFTTAAPAAALTGTIGLFYTGGANMLGYVVAYLLVSPVIYLLIGTRLRRIGARLKYQTQADFAGRFFQSPLLHYLTSVGGIVFLVPYFAVNPIALGLVLHATTGTPYALGVALFLLVTLAYSYFGGLRAIAQTDVFHGFLLLVFFLITVPVLFAHAGGFGSVLAHDTGTITNPIEFVTWVVYLGLTPAVWADRCLRMYSVVDDRNIRRSAISIGVTLGIAGLSFFLLGVVSRAIIPGLSPTTAQTSLAASLGKAAPWLIPFYIVSLWGGGMSGLSSGMLATANMFTKDLYVRVWKPLWADFTRPDAERDRATVKVGRAFMVVVAVLSAVIAGPQPTFIYFLIFITLGSFLQFVPMFLGGLYWRGASTTAVVVSFVIGVALTAYWTFVTPPPFGFEAGLAALLVNALLFVIISLLVPDTAGRQTERDTIRVVATTPFEDASVNGTGTPAVSLPGPVTPSP